jgi:hypothetical protein
MDRGSIRRARHQPVEHVELADQMTLPNATDRRVARHLSGIFPPERQQPDARPAARGSGSSLAPGMAGADHQNIVHD